MDQREIADILDTVGCQGTQAFPDIAAPRGIVQSLAIQDILVRPDILPYRDTLDIAHNQGSAAIRVQAYQDIQVIAGQG